MISNLHRIVHWLKRHHNGNNLGTYFYNLSEHLIRTPVVFSICQQYTYLFLAKLVGHAKSRGEIEQLPPPFSNCGIT